MICKVSLQQVIYRDLGSTSLSWSTVGSVTGTPVIKMACGELNTSVPRGEGPLSKQYLRPYDLIRKVSDVTTSINVRSSPTDTCSRLKSMVAHVGEFPPLVSYHRSCRKLYVPLTNYRAFS